MAISVSTLNINDDQHDVSLKQKMNQVIVKEDVKLSSEDCIKLEQTYGAHKYVTILTSLHSSADQ